MANLTTFNDTCNPTYLNYADVPTNYNSSDTPLCGISYPSDLLPSANFSSCCTTASFNTSNACFQYCTPAGEWDTSFSQCLYDKLMNDTGSMEVWCNPAAQKRKGEEQSMASALSVRLAWMGFALLVVGCINVLL